MTGIKDPAGTSTHDLETTDRVDAWATAHNENTTSEQLADIVGRYPEFAATIVAHPNCYPELADWARQNGLLAGQPTLPQPDEEEVVHESQPSLGLDTALSSAHRVEPPLETTAVTSGSTGSVSATNLSHLASTGLTEWSRRETRIVVLFGVIGGIATALVANTWSWLLSNPLDFLVPAYPEATGLRALLYAGVYAVVMTTHGLFVGLLVRRPGVIIATLALSMVMSIPVDLLLTPILYPEYEFSLGERVWAMVLYTGGGMLAVAVAGELIRLVLVRAGDSFISKACLGLAIPMGWTVSLAVQGIAGFEESWSSQFESVDWLVWLIGLTVMSAVLSGLIPAAIATRVTTAGSDSREVSSSAAHPGFSFTTATVASGPVGLPDRDGRYEHPKATQILVFALIGLFVFAPLAIVAWVSGAKTKAEVAANPAVYRNSSSLQAGYVLGIIGTLVWAAGILVLIVALAALFSLGR